MTDRVIKANVDIAVSDVNKLEFDKIDSKKPKGSFTARNSRGVSMKSNEAAGDPLLQRG